MLEQIKVNEVIKTLEYRINQLKNLDEYILSLSATYENLEMYLNLKDFDILSLFKDSRRDDGDDGGYIISVSKKNEKFYVHILEANYNGNLEYYIFDEEDLEKSKTTRKDFYVFNTSKEVEEFINKFVEDLDYCVNEEKENDEFYGEQEEAFQKLSKRENFNWNDNYCEHLRVCFFPYSEYNDMDDIKQLYNFNEIMKNNSLFKLKKQMYFKSIDLFELKFKILLDRLQNNNFDDLDKSDILKIENQINKTHLKDYPKKYVSNSIEYILKGYCDYFVLDVLNYKPEFKKDKIDRDRFNQYYKNYLEPMRFKNSTEYKEEFGKVKIDFSDCIRALLSGYLEEYLES